MNYFWANQSTKEQNEYDSLLKIIGALSNLSSENSDVPYLYYRIAENIFCKAFKANNLSRSDISIDSSKMDYGIGLKTFLHKNGRPIEKIAEFNKDRQNWDNKSTNIEKVRKIAELRNIRIDATSGISGIAVEKMLYHCVSREKAKFILYETSIDKINLDKLRLIKCSENTMYFEDGINEYSFNQSKSTLYMRFNVKSIHEIDVHIFDDPFKILHKYILSENLQTTNVSNLIIARIYLPLYSEKGVIHVPEYSGLNQWNAKGRPRDKNELYIPIPVIVKQKNPGFFPPRNDTFKLKIPNGKMLSAKICQDNDKALMSNPNSDLGKWLLRDVLKLREGELATYEKLEEIGIDSVEILKYSDNTYEITFKKLGSYEEYRNSL